MGFVEESSVLDGNLSKELSLFFKHLHLVLHLSAEWNEIEGIYLLFTPKCYNNGLNQLTGNNMVKKTGCSKKRSHPFDSGDKPAPLPPLTSRDVLKM